MNDGPVIVVWAMSERVAAEEAVRRDEARHILASTRMPRAYDPAPRWLAPLGWLGVGFVSGLLASGLF